MRWNDGRIAVGLALLMWANPLHAAEISWRADFAAARKEAAAAAKPLLLDFGTESCLWCKKLDATTFRDRSLVELVAERFIPVKVDGERQEALTQSLGVQAFPTIVLLSAEGKVIGRHEGFADVAKMTALLRQAPGREVPKSSAAPRSPGIELLVQARADHTAGRGRQKRPRPAAWWPRWRRSRNAGAKSPASSTPNSSRYGRRSRPNCRRHACRTLTP